MYTARGFSLDEKAYEIRIETKGFLQKQIEIPAESVRDSKESVALSVYSSTT